MIEQVRERGVVQKWYVNDIYRMFWPAFGATQVFEPVLRVLVGFGYEPFVYIRECD
jgi:hypothetical protein